LGRKIQNENKTEEAFKFMRETNFDLLKREKTKVRG
jgi:hypothetical protein